MNAKALAEIAVCVTGAEFGAGKGIGDSCTCGLDGPHTVNAASMEALVTQGAPRKAAFLIIAKTQKRS